MTYTYKDNTGDQVTVSCLHFTGESVIELELKAEDNQPVSVYIELEDVPDFVMALLEATVEARKGRKISK